MHIIVAAQQCIGCVVRQQRPIATLVPIVSPRCDKGHRDDDRRMGAGFLADMREEALHRGCVAATATAPAMPGDGAGL